MKGFSMKHALAAFTLLLVSLPALADETALRWLDNDYYKVAIDVRPRIELADIEGFDASESYSLRARLGLGTKPLHGFSGFVEGEGTWALAKTQYFDGTSTNSRGQSVIADPQNLELNRAWLKFETTEWLEVKAVGGRQRIILDDSRFVGNVGWRQNEQTFDAALGQTSLGVDDLALQYIYVWDVRRIFGDQGPTAATRDFDSDSHLVRIHYAGFDFLRISAFAYLLDFDLDSPGNSSDSYGLRLSGGADVSDEIAAGYAASYAYQTDAARNPASYETHYAAVSGELEWKPLGSLGVGYELLGSDDGSAVFVTPLATGHKFNGFADAFLNNGGPAGLQDLYVTLAPRLPFELAGKLSYHEFWSDEDGRHLGHEVDAVLSRSIDEHVTALTKFAWFDGRSRGPADRWRFWLQLTFQY
jgi:hypothetical protein